LEYDLNADSVCIDIGGYEGQWASDIFGRYGCTIHVFEPVPLLPTISGGDSVGILEFMCIHSA
jgi:hypothetical protein